MCDEKQIHEYIGQMKNIEEIILEFLDKETDYESDFNKLNQIIDDLKIKNDKYILKELLLLIAQISRNYHHFNDFFNKIESILNIFKEKLKTFYSRSEIFNIFSKCKRILLYLFEEKLLIPEEKIFNIFINNEYYKKASYAQYFCKEFKDLIKKVDNKPIDFVNFMLNGKPKPIFYSEADQDPELFDKKRKSGENDNYICELIRNDSVKEFIIHVNRTNIPLSSRIQNSIYETNDFLIKNQNQTLIEYAAFFGSIQIFQYLRMNNAAMEPSLFIYAIHGKNPELIHLLEESAEPISNEIHEKNLIESIKCHHFELTNYIYDKKQTNASLTNKYLKYYNFIYLNDKIDDLLANLENFLFDLCTYGNRQLTKYLFESKKIDINMKKQYKSTKKIIENEGGLFGDFLDMISTNSDFNENEKTITTNDEKTPLIIAIEKGNNDIVELLLQQPEIDVNLVCDGFEQESTYDGIFESKTKKTALFASIENDNFDIVELLLKHPNIDVQLKCTIDNYFNYFSMDTSGRYKIEETPLFLAVCYKKYQIVKLFLSRDDVDVNSKFKRIEFKPDDKFQYTIEDYVRDEKTALHAAAYDGDIEMMKLLLSCKKVDLNSKFIYHYVNSFDTFEEDNDSYDEIIKQGNALFIAIDKGFNEIAELLLSKSEFDVNAIYTIIKYITKSANNKTIKYEVKKEVFTALHFATKKQNIGVIKKLFEFKNIDVNAKDEKGRRPIDLTNNEEIKALLKK